MLRELELARDNDNDETSGDAEAKAKDEDEDEDCVDPQVKRSRTLPRTRTTNRDAELVRMLQWNSVLFHKPPSNIVVLLEKAMASSYATCVLNEDSSELAVTIRRMIFVCFRSVLTDRLQALLGNRTSAVRVFNVIAGMTDVRSLGPLGLSDSVRVDAVRATWSRMLCDGVDRVLSSLRSSTKAEAMVDGSKPVSVVQCLVEHKTGLYHVAVPAEWLPLSIVMPNEFVPGRICMHSLDALGCPDTDGIIAGLIASDCRAKISCHHTVVGSCALKCRS
jgi:hypothetical protein